MSSFINLMANDIWSESDIKARLHAEVRSEITEFAETELNRALNGFYMKIHTLTPGEQATLGQFVSVNKRVELLGIAARSDMALLREVLSLETAKARLLREAVQPIMSEPIATEGVETPLPSITNAGEVEKDTIERDAATLVVASASEAALSLYALRNPLQAAETVEPPAATP